MKQRGRKSAAALTSVADLSGRVPAIVPPASLSAAALTIFRRTLSRAPLNWFCSEQGEVLGCYAESMATTLRLREMAAEATGAEFLALTRAAQSEARIALAYATGLRLTPHSRQDAQSAARKADGTRAAGGPTREEWREYFAAQKEHGNDDQ